MAKFSFIFIVISIFCIQSLMGARIIRDAPEADVKQPTVQKTLEEAVDQLQNFIKSSLSQEQLEKIGKELQTFSEQVSTKGKELFEQADDAFKKLQQKNTEH